MRSKGLTQTYMHADTCHAAILAIKEACTVDGRLVIGPKDAKAIADLCAAHDKAQDRIRVIRGRPLPGSLSPQKRGKKPAPIAVMEPLTDDSQAANG